MQAYPILCGRIVYSSWFTIGGCLADPWLAGCWSRHRDELNCFYSYSGWLVRMPLFCQVLLSTRFLNCIGKFKFLVHSMDSLVLWYFLSVLIPGMHYALYLLCRPYPGVTWLGWLTNARLHFHCLLLVFFCLVHLFTWDTVLQSFRVHIFSLYIRDS